MLEDSHVDDQHDADVQVSDVQISDVQGGETGTAVPLAASTTTTVAASSVAASSVADTAVTAAAVAATPLDVPVDGPADMPTDMPTDMAPAATVTRRGRYRLGERVGRGGASVVHRGWDQRLERAVAVKVFTDAGPAPADREARLAAGLDHPGVVPVYDVEELDGHDAVVMPLVDGPNLAVRLAEGGPLPLAEALEIGSQLAAGLAHVHAQGIVHRDVKPSNVLLGDRGARLTDFGIARVPGTTTISGDGLVLGTAAYLSPEQIRAEEVGPAADVFALGLLLVECLTGTSCYPKDPAACAARIDREPELPSDLDVSEALGRDLAHVLTGLTRLDADARPTAADTARRLTRLHLVATGVVDAGAPTGPTEEHASSAPRGTHRWTETAERLAAAAPLSGGLLLVATTVAVLALLAGRADVAIPVIVSAMAAQGAVLCFTLARRQRTARL